MPVVPEPSVDHENLERLHQSVVVELDRQLRLPQRNSQCPVEITANPQSASPTTLRLTPSDTSQVQTPSPQARVEALTPVQNGQGAPIDLQADVLMTVEAIERAGSYVLALQEQVSRHQDTIETRERALAELGQEKDALAGDLTRCEDIARTEGERATALEKRLHAAEVSRQAAEQQVAELQSHVRTLMAAVGRSLHLDKGSGRGSFNQSKR